MNLRDDMINLEENTVVRLVHLAVFTPAAGSLPYEFLEPAVHQFSGFPMLGPAELLVAPERSAGL